MKNLKKLAEKATPDCLDKIKSKIGTDNTAYHPQTFVIVKKVASIAAVFVFALAFIGFIAVAPAIIRRDDDAGSEIDGETYVESSVEYAENCDTTSDETAERENDTEEEVIISDGGEFVILKDGFKVENIYYPCPDKRIKMDSMKFNDRYYLYLAYDVSSDEDNICNLYSDTILYILDTEKGEFIADSFALADTHHTSYATIRYCVGYCELLSVYYNGDDAYFAECGYRITESDGKFTVEALNVGIYPDRSQNYISPDGKYSLYQEHYDVPESGAIILENIATGEKHTAITNISWYCEDDTSMVRQYIPAGFLSNRYFAYEIYGWECVLGFGIYDIESGTRNEFTDGMSLISISSDGKHAFLSEHDTDFANTYYYKLNLETEEKTLLCTISNTEITDRCYNLLYRNGHWLKVYATRFEILSEDMTEKEAIVYCDNLLWTNVYVYDNTVTCIRHRSTDNNPDEVGCQWYASANWDIDDDGVVEECSLSECQLIDEQPLPYKYKFLITVKENGLVEYQNTFYSPSHSIAFDEKDGVPQLVIDSVYYRLYIDGDELVIENNYSVNEQYKVISED